MLNADIPGGSVSWSDDMGRIVLDASLRAKFENYDQPIELCDENGNAIGYFMPLSRQAATDGPKKGIPFSDQQLDEFRNAGGGGQLAEFWKRMLQQ